MNDALYTLLEDAQKYQKLANRADEALSRPAAVSQDEELASILAADCTGEPAPCRAQAKRLLAQRVAE